MLSELAKIRERLQGLADPVDLFAAMFLHTPVGFQIWNSSGHSVLVNPAFRALFGSEPPPDYCALNDDVARAQGLLEHIRRAFAGETVHIGPFWYDPRELRHVTVTEGRRVAIEATFFPLHDHTGTPYVATSFKDVTAEMKLRANEESLTITLRSIGDGVIATDVEGRVVRMNPVAERLTGLAIEQAAGQPLRFVLRAIHEGTREPCPDLAAEVLRSGSACALPDQTLLLGHDGSERPIADSAAPIRDAEGRLHGVVLVFRDQTQERSARLNRERLQAIVENAPVAFFSLDAEGRYTFLTGRRVASLGLRQEDFIGHSFFDKVATGGAHAALRRALAGEPVTFRGESLAGGAFECRLVPARDAEGTVGGLMGVSYDVTEQVRAELALRHNEERLQLALTAGRMVVAELDFQGGVNTFSSNASEVFGCTQAQLASLSASIELIHPDDRARAQTALSHALKHGKPLEDVQYRIVRPSDGVVIWIERRLTMVKNERGEVTGAHGLLIDITDRKLVEENSVKSAELALENARVLEASRLKSEFLANMSHELRTPLNAIIGFTELLYDGQVDPGSPRHHEFLGDILASGRHLVQLVNDVLDLAKVESGKLSFRAEDVSLPKLVAEVCGILGRTATQKHIQLETEHEPALVEIALDADRFKQVLFNYLSNALKFTPEGGRVIVRTRAEQATTFRLEVEDNGIGIGIGDLPRLFVEFHQLEASTTKRHQGTGLGLVLTRRLVEAQGGTVGVQSSFGHGSTFHAILPRRLDLRSQPEPSEGAH